MLALLLSVFFFFFFVFFSSSHFFSTSFFSRFSSYSRFSLLSPVIFVSKLISRHARRFTPSLRSPSMVFPPFASPRFYFSFPPFFGAFYRHLSRTNFPSFRTIFFFLLLLLPFFFLSIFSFLLPFPFFPATREPPLSQYYHHYSYIPYPCMYPPYNVCDKSVEIFRKGRKNLPPQAREEKADFFSFARCVMSFTYIYTIFCCYRSRSLMWHKIPRVFIPSTNQNSKKQFSHYFTLFLLKKKKYFFFHASFS